MPTSSVTERETPASPTPLGQDGFERRAFDAAKVKPRKTSFEFPAEDMPRLWVGDGSYVNTHILNSLHLCLPPFEDLLCRVFKAHLENIQDPYLADQVRGFVGQEASHSKGHTKFCDTLRAQGYEIDAYIGFMDWVFKNVYEKWLGKTITVSAAAGFEHYTDLLVAIILDSKFLDYADPRAKEFFAWHAAEEAEHNAVAYELLRSVNNSYALRQLGNVLGLGIILSCIIGGTVHLLWQDNQLFRWKTLKDLTDFFFTKYGIAGKIVQMFFHYLRPGYHPDDDDYSRFAKMVL